MELTQLRYFAAVAELQHVTRAAERMHVAQPAITKSIHRRGTGGHGALGLD